MYNEKIRKITSLMLMAVMVAGGMTVASSGMMPAAHAADDELYVSAQEIGNFAGIQVIEIVIDDSDRSDTDTSEGRPSVTFAGDDVYMAQATDGNWYAYVANQLAIGNYADTNLIYKSDIGDGDTISNSNAIVTYANATSFLEGSKSINTNAESQNSGCAAKTAVCVDGFNNDADAMKNWPFIQSYNISVGEEVNIQYGSSGNVETVRIDYDYDDDKLRDIVLDRQLYPPGSNVHITSTDSLLNLSPVADDTWVFFTDGTTAYVFEDESYTIITDEVEWAAIGFEEGPITTHNGDNVYTFTNSTILDSFGEEGGNGFSEAIILKTSNGFDNVFVNYDNSEKSGLVVTADGNASIEYKDNHSVQYDTFNGALGFNGPSIEEWLSGVEIELVLTDEDRNLNSRIEESIDILGGEVPYIEIGNPITIDSIDVTIGNGTDIILNNGIATASKTLDLTIDETTNGIFVNATWPTGYISSIDNSYVFPYVNYDFTAFGGPSGTYYTGTTDGTGEDLPSNVVVQSNSTYANFQFTLDNEISSTTIGTAYFDLFFYGQIGDIATLGDIDDNIVRVNDAFYRFALEETDDNTANFDGTLEYIMINQLNVFDKSGTYDRIDAADDTVVIIVNDDMDGADAVTVSYEDTRSTSAQQTISVAEDANTHTGVIELDSSSYSSGNTVEVTLIDVDLNTDSDTIQSYDVSSKEWVGDNSVWLAQLKINDILFDDSCGLDLGLSDTNFTLTETGDQTGIFVGTIKLPSEYCVDSSTTATTNGLDLKFEYQDYSDASGKPNETTSKSTIRSNTGSVELDSSVYPVPFGGNLNPFYTYGGSTNTNDDTTLGEGAVIITIQVSDPDFNLASSGEDTMNTNVLKIVAARGSDDKTLWEVATDGTTVLFDVIDLSGELLVETDPESGIFEIEVTIPDQDYGFSDTDNGKSIQQGDILTITYTDPNDASGDSNTVTDSATFDLRNAVLQSDKKEYIIGSDAIITLIEPDLNLDSGSAETWSLDLINWDSDAGDRNLSNAIFDANPAGLRETGDNTGIFQVVIELPEKIGTDALERGEVIQLEYQDYGPAGANYIGDDDEDISIDIATSNYGASVTLDQKIYTWTDKVYVTIVSPDHNFDDSSIDEIGGTSDSEINVSTRSDELERYKLVETGPDTGIFTGELQLTGFTHDADGDGDQQDARAVTEGTGPTSGLLESKDDDGLTVSFEASDGKTVLGSALIRWNIGEVQWLEASYPATGSGVIRVIDPDMNWNPESVDSFDITVWSDSSTGGVNLSVTETNEATGIFEGTVFFTTTQGSSGSRLNVSEGDTIVAKYEDNTLPAPYSKADELGVTATANIGTIVPPLERAPAGNLRAVDAFGNSIDIITIDQQIQVEVDIENGQDRDQKFAYLLQVQDGDGVTVKLSWVTGVLGPNQQFTSAASWIPELAGDYEATAFVWESVDNPTALSPPITTTLTVR